MNRIFSKLKESIEKLFRTGFFYIFGSNVLNKIFGFISSVFIVRLVTKNEYGIYTTALNHLSFFLIISGMGMVSAVLQMCSEQAKNKEKNLQIYEYGSSIGIKFNIMLGIAIMIFAQLSKSNISGSDDILFFLAFIPFFEIINEFQKVFFRSRLDNKHFAMANSIGAFLVVVCSVTGAFIYSVKGLIIGRYIAAILIAVITASFMKAPVKIRTPKKNFDDKSVLYKIALISMANGGLSELLALIDIFLIGEILGAANAVADYKIAIVIPTALMFIPASICIYIYPYFSMNKDNGSWLRASYKKILYAMGAMNLLLTLGMLIFAPLIIKIVFGAQYISAVPMFRIAAINYFFGGTFRTIAGNLLVTQRKLKFNFYMSLFAGVLNLISNYILISLYGAIGAAWTTLGVTVISGLICSIYFSRVISKK